MSKDPAATPNAPSPSRSGLDARREGPEASERDKGDRADKETMPAAAPRPAQVSRPDATQRASMIDLDWMEDDSSVDRITETGLEVPRLAVRARDRAALTLLTGLNAGEVFALDALDTTLGRSREANIRVDDVGISRIHARIVRGRDGSFFIEDLRSTNGTFVAGRRIERARLETGDHIQVGPSVHLRFALVDETEEALARQLYESSTRDPLTRAYNRKYFLERLQAEVAYANRHRSKLSVLLFDLDHFKRVNDTLGHLAGDEVLRAVSSQVTRLIRAEDVFARYGGEEFVVLVRGIEPSHVTVFAERIRKSIERLAVDWDGRSIRVTLSTGISSLAECGENPAGEALLLLADARLYRAKREGRNRVCAH